MELRVLNHVFCKALGPEDLTRLAQTLSYKVTTWRDGPFHMIQKDVRKPLIKKGIILGGFLPRIEKFCSQYGIPLLVHTAPDLKTTPNPTGQGFLPPRINKLLPQQERAIKAMLGKGRGVIHHPTGAGKTVIFMAFLTLYPKSKALIIVQTQDLLTQTFNRLKDFIAEKEIGIIGANLFAPRRVTVAMIQSLYRGKADDFIKDVDIVIVDEAHHISKFGKPFYNGKGATYANVLSKIDAPIRIGFTATLPKEEEKARAMEGYLGPVISTETRESYIKEKKVSKVKLILRKLPETVAAREAKNYPDVYKYGVIFNSRKTRQVLADAESMSRIGRTSLILVSSIQHGSNILEAAQRILPQRRVTFVYGSISRMEREEIRKDFDDKFFDIVIADVVWKEGIDIPSLGAIINAAGGKSEIQTLQFLGRGSRATEEKDLLYIFDYYDPSHRYLRDHFCERLTLFFDMGWIGGEDG